MMKKRILAVFLVIGLVMSMAVACGSEPEPPAGEVDAGNNEEVEADLDTDTDPDDEEITSENERVDLVFATSQSKWRAEYQVMADAIARDHNIHIEFQVIPDDQYINLIQIRLATGEVPDIFEFNTPTQNAMIGAAENTVDLSNEPWVERLVAPGLVRDAVDGNIYGMPREAASFFGAVYYNVEALRNAGIENPDPQTMEEFMDILQAVQDNTPEVTPIFMADGDTWTTQIFMTLGIPVTLYPNDGDIFGQLERNELQWTDIPEIRTVIEQFVEIYERGFVNPDHGSARYEMALEAVATGRAAMMLNGEWAAESMMSTHPDTLLGAFVIPWGDRQMMAVGQFVQGLFIPNESPNIEEAKRFLNLWSQPEYQALFYETSPGFPAFADVDGGEVLPFVEELVTRFIDTGLFTYQINDQLSVLSPIWGDLWDNYVAIVSGIMTIDEALEDWQFRVDDFMSQLGAPGF